MCTGGAGHHGASACGLGDFKMSQGDCQCLLSLSRPGREPRIFALKAGTRVKALWLGSEPALASAPDPQVTVLVITHADAGVNPKKFNRRHGNPTPIDLT